MPIRPTPAAALLAAALAGCTGLPPEPGAAPGAAARSSPAARPIDAAVAAPLPADASALANAMRGAALVLLGEMHDNPAQHRLRAEALARVVSAGARPALAFEQFDRERQADLDAARAERAHDADALIARAGGPGWDWAQYRPFVQLALDHGLPIVAANLSRTDASRVVREGFGAVFDAAERAALGLDALPAELLAALEVEVDRGHCGVLPRPMLEPMARAQIARDAMLAQRIAPHAARGVVLLTGNAHARRDLGVARWLTPPLRERTIAIGLLEADTQAATPVCAFDRVIVTDAPPRVDPCVALRERLRGGAAPQGR
jgi:uncharacterized iron-regulated protein